MYAQHLEHSGRGWGIWRGGCRANRLSQLYIDVMWRTMGSVGWWPDGLSRVGMIRLASPELSSPLMESTFGCIYIVMSFTNLSTQMHSCIFLLLLWWLIGHWVMWQGPFWVILAAWQELMQFGTNSRGEVMSYVRARMLCAILHATNLCIRLGPPCLSD